MPDWNAPLDVHAYIGRVPKHATGKGMFLAQLQKEVQSRGLELPTREKFYAFRDYPLPLAMELIVEAAKLLHPGLSLREGIRRLAWSSYDVFRETMIGRVVFGAVGVNLGAIFKLAGRAVGHTTNVGQLETEPIDDRSVIVHVRDVYLFADCYSAGMAEGVLIASRRKGFVAQQMTGPTTGSFYVRWQ
jgi:uncharacterized protein (TIGR02265 family)